MDSAVNPEKIIKAIDDEKLGRCFGADLFIPDGIGILWAADSRQVFGALSC